MIKKYSDLCSDIYLGGKIDNLLKIRHGFNIPKGFIITSVGDINKSLYNYYENIINTDFYICRSSMSYEDSKKISYAGLFQSIEGKYSEKLLCSDIRNIFDSINNTFLDEYENKVLGKRLENRNMNVLVQEFIVGEVSGIYFSNYKGDRLIEYIKGCNQFLVDGVVKSNKVTLDKDYNILNHIKNKQYKYIGENLDIFIFDKQNNSLDENILNKLIYELKRLEDFFDFEIDVEWTISKGKIYILQIRPITTI